MDIVRPIVAMIHVGSALLYVTGFIGAGVWRRRSMAVREALDAGDDGRVVTLLTEPRARLLRWIELILLVTIVALMVLRPA